MCISNVSYAVGEERKLARSILARLEQDGAYRGMYGYEMAIIHGALHDFDNAFDCLNRAHRERSTWLAYVDVDPRLDRLRGDPRFTVLRAALGIDVVSSCPIGCRPEAAL